MNQWSLPAILLFKNTWIWKLQTSIKNYLLVLWFTRNTKNKIPFLSISLAFIKSEISADFLSEMVGYFGDLFRILPKSIFLSYCFISLIAKKVKTRDFLSFFSFSPFSQKSEKINIFRFLCLGSLIDRSHKMAWNWDQNRRIRSLPSRWRICIWKLRCKKKYWGLGLPL